VMRPGGRIDRYPINQNNSVAVNVYAGYPEGYAKRSLKK
jgi:hypothetical protein